MKKILLILLTLVYFNSFSQDSIPAPNPETWVVDDANILNRDEEISERLLKWEEQYKTGVEYAIVTVNSLEGYDPEWYATEVGNKWGVGKNGSDNGIVILIAPNEHRLWVSTGYGIEYIITDMEAKRFLDEAYILEDLKAGEYDNGTLRLIDLIHEKIGRMSKADREEWRSRERLAQYREAQRQSDESQEAILNFILIAIILGIIAFIVYKIVNVFRIKKHYSSLKNKINIDIDAIRNSNKTKPFIDTDIVVELLSETTKLETSVKKSNPLKIRQIEEMIFILNDEYTEVASKYNKICSLIDTKTRMENDVVTMIDFLSKWATHPNVPGFLSTLQGMVGNIKLTTAIPYSYDSIKTRYNELKNDINIRKDIESGTLDLAKYNKVGEKAKIVAKDLSLIFGGEIVIDEAKITMSKVSGYMNEGTLEKNWGLIREMWVGMTKKLDSYYNRAEEILTIETEYKTALKNIPSRLHDIECKVSEAEIEVKKSGVGVVTKRNLDLFVTTWKKTSKSPDSIATLDAIKLSGVLLTLITEINTILNKARKEHNTYLEDLEEASKKNSYSYSSGGGYGGGSGSGSGGGYGGGHFGGGGAGKSW